MTTEKRETARRFRVWRGVVFPLAATVLFGVAVWFFSAKMSGDQERAEEAAIRLEAYARLEAREIVALASEHAKTLVARRLADREKQRANLRLEVRGVMDAVYRLLTAGLDKSRKNAAARRDVGNFPPGFEGVRSFLEISPAEPRGDEALEALRSFSTELATLLPAGSSLVMVEDSSRELLSLGGGATPEMAVSEAIVREFIFDDGGRSRHWAVRVELSAPDASPVPDADEIAGFISQYVGNIRLDDVEWRGWLLGRDGKVKAMFPVLPGVGGSAESRDTTPYIDVPGQWFEIDGQRLVWLERPSPNAGAPNQVLTPAVSVSIAKPAPPLAIGDELLSDWRWCLTLGFFAAATVAGWVWFARLYFVTRRRTDDAVESAAGSVGATRVRKRLVRDESLARAIPEVQGVIVADIGPDGSVSVNAPPPPPPQPRVMPSGSLFRLQSIHRGREGGQGSRILDQARHPVLRDLASRVRPPASLGADPSARARSATKADAISNMKSPTGWKKVEE